LKNKQGIKLTIVGDGTLINKAQELAKNNKNINFLGKKNGEEVKAELLKHDCLIVPSLCYENSPTVIYEASAFNLPVIASDLGGISELIKKYKGMLFEAKNSNDLINKINYFRLNFSKYVGAELPQIGEERYAEKILEEIKKAT
ncbi:MAG: glycosyltransferase family 4 protein, partial [Patescibacteria group bacterium]